VELLLGCHDIVFHVKYLPLIWSVLWRKPTEAVLVLLAVTAAFTLFGLMVGMDTTVHQVIASKRMDRIAVNVRLVPLTLGMTDTIAKMDGVAAAGAWTEFSGYYREPKTFVFVDAVHESARKARPELPLTPAQWNMLFANPTGVFVSRTHAAMLGLKRGDHLPVSVGPGTLADNSRSLNFEVLGIVDDEPDRGGMMILGNFHYVDAERSPDRKQVSFWVAVKNPAKGAQIAASIDHYFANSGSPTSSITFRDAQQNESNSGIPINVMTWGIGGAGLFMILFLVGNSIAQSVRDRTSEFAVLKTLGFPDWRVTGLVFAEALVPCITGATLGLALSSLVAAVPRSFLTGAFARMPAPTLTPAVQGLAIAAAVLLALLSASIPILRLRRLSVPAALARR
jgi:putative ABC transport system permease protein